MTECNSPLSKSIKKSSKLDLIKQQLINKQDRTHSLNSSKQLQVQPQTPQANLKLSPSKSMTNYYKSTGSSNSNENTVSNKMQFKKSNTTYTENTGNGIVKMPTKDSVIKKMKKITKAVQELFKATKESEFGL